MRLFKAPYNWKRLSEKYRKINKWFEQKYHGMSWKSGEYDYTLIECIIRDVMKDVIIIYVKNSICKNWLEKRWGFKQIVDLSEYGYPCSTQRRQLSVVNYM